MLPQPGVSKLLGKGLQRVVRKAMLRAGRSKEARALGVGAGEGPSALERFGLPHEAHPLACLTQAGIVDLPCCFQAHEQRVLLVRTHSQRHLADEGGCPFGRVGSRMRLSSHDTSSSGCGTDVLM